MGLASVMSASVVAAVVPLSSEYSTFLAVMATVKPVRLSEFGCAAVDRGDRVRVVGGEHRVDGVAGRAQVQHRATAVVAAVTVVAEEGGAASAETT